MAYNLNLPVDNTADIRENFRSLKEDKIVAAATAITADTAVKLANARNISLLGDAKGNAIFDGSADITINTVINGGNADTVDGKHASDIIQACSIYAVPSGAIQHFARQTAPDGWLKADGSAISRAQYANLFAAVGTMFGAGDGSKTFNLPDLRGEFVRGFDDGRGADVGRVLGSSQTDEFKNHTHSLSIGKTEQQGNPWVHDTWSFAQGNYYISTTPNILATGGAETRPRNIALLACIKY